MKSGVGTMCLWIRGFCARRKLRKDLDLLDTKSLFKGRRLLAYVVKVTDGDTLWCNMETEFGTRSLKIRIIGYDAPELHSEDHLEARHGAACTAFVEHLLKGRMVILECGELDLYGRLLVNLWIRGRVTSENLCIKDCRSSKETQDRLISLCEIMLKWTSSIPYNGRKKKKNSKIQGHHSSSEFHPVFRSLLQTQGI